jgi:anthranilate synthase component II
MKVLILDNYDSFTYNLYQYFGELGAQLQVSRNDKISLDEIRAYGPDRIVISPGPGRPDNPDYFGVGMETILELGQEIPILGICLGHQGIVCAFGGRLARLDRVMHGKASTVFHNRDSIFKGVPQSFEAMRYHSLIARAESLPEELDVIAKTFNDVIMAVRHRSLPIWGIQFHPESIGTEYGMKILANFLNHSEKS